MRKFGALLFNEIMKISKKTVVYVLLGIMTLAMVGCSALIKYTSNEEMYFESEDKISYDSEYYEEIESDIKDIEKRIEMAEGEDRIVLLGHLRDLKLEYTYYEHECLYAEKYKAAQYSYKMEILNNLLDLKHYILDIEYGCELYTEEEKNEFSSSENEEAKNYSLVRQEYDELFSLLENGEYSEYIDYQKNIILDDPAIDEATKKSRVEFFDLL